VSHTKITDKQRVFVAEYIKDFNATAAYIRAGYSKNGARQSSAKLLTNTDIMEMIQKTLEKVEDTSVVTQAMVLNGLLKEASDYQDGSPTSRVAAWSWLGKNLKMWTDKVELEMPTVRIKDFTGENA